MPAQLGGGAAAAPDGMKALEHIKAATKPNSDLCFSNCKRFGLICFLQFFDDVIARRRCRGVHDFSENALILLVGEKARRRTKSLRLSSQRTPPMFFFS
jgi:hypothetical protein